VACQVLRFVFLEDYVHFPASEITRCTPLARAYTQKGMQGRQISCELAFYFNRSILSGRRRLGLQRRQRSDPLLP